MLSNTYIKENMCLLKGIKKMPFKTQIKHCYTYANKINLYNIIMSYTLYTWYFKENIKENILVYKLAASLHCYNKYNKASMSCYILALIIK